MNHFFITRTKKQQFWTISGLAIIIIILYLVPGNPPVEESSSENIKKRISVAVQTIQNSSDPMQGISMLKEIARDNPRHKLALYHLGFFCLQSGQFDKALRYFKTITDTIVTDKEKIHPVDSIYKETLHLLGNTYAAMAQNSEAIKYLSQYITLLNDSFKKNEIAMQIRQLMSSSAIDTSNAR